LRHLASAEFRRLVARRAHRSGLAQPRGLNSEREYTHRRIGIERFALPVSSRWSFGGDSIRCVIEAVAHAPQNLLFSFIKAGTVVAIFSPPNPLVDIDRHPFLVFGKRRVRLLQITELTRFVRRTRHVRKQRPVFGRFRSVLLCREHLTGPFRDTRERDWSLTSRRAGSIYRR
jgi:hypothetical protein